jgi:hypothetical protein
MKIEKLGLPKSKFDINLKFYFFLKYLVKTSLSDNQANEILKICILNSKINIEITIEKIISYIEAKIKTGSKKQKLIFEIIDETPIREVSAIFSPNLSSHLFGKLFHKYFKRCFVVQRLPWSMI